MPNVSPEWEGLTLGIQRDSYLGDVDTSLLEGAVIGVLGAHVAVLAPVAREGAVHTGEAAETEKSWLNRHVVGALSIILLPWSLSRHSFTPSECVRLLLPHNG